MVLSNVRQQIVDVPTDVDTGCLNPGNDLHKHETLTSLDSCTHSPYLGYHFKPRVYLYVRETAGHGMTHFIMCSILEPQSQQPESVL
jgi:hypothetical protein